jgi:hypothetical protein
MNTTQDKRRAKETTHLIPILLDCVGELREKRYISTIFCSILKSLVPTRDHRSDFERQQEDIKGQQSFPVESRLRLNLELGSKTLAGNVML